MTASHQGANPRLAAAMKLSRDRKFLVLMEINELMSVDETHPPISVRQVQKIEWNLPERRRDLEMGSNRAHFPHGISSSKNLSAKLDPELVRYGTRVGRLSCGSAPVFRAFSAEPFRYLRSQIHFGHRQRQRVSPDPRPSLGGLGES